MSAPFPAWSRTMATIAMHMSVCRMTSAMYIGLLTSRGSPGAGGLLDDRDERRRVETRATDERSVDVGVGDERLHVVGVDAATIQNPQSLGDLLRGELGHETAQVAVHLRRLRGGGVGAGADRPHRLIREDDPLHGIA